MLCESEIEDAVFEHSCSEFNSNAASSTEEDETPRQNSAVSTVCVKAKQFCKKVNIFL